MDRAKLNLGLASGSLRGKCTCHIGLLPCQIHGWNMVQHGVSCEKVPHGNKTGMLHGPDDDRPYDVDGCSYCGRCHHAL